MDCGWRVQGFVVPAKGEDMSASKEAGGDLLVWPKLDLGCQSCCPGEIRAYADIAGVRLIGVRLICIDCGAFVDIPPRAARPRDVSAGVPEGVWGIPETLTPPDSPKRGRGRPRTHDDAKPWIAAGMSKSWWYERKRKAKAKV